MQLIKMSENVKALYLAKDLAELQEKSTLKMSNYKDRQNESLINSAKKLIQSAEKVSNMEHCDEELVYMYLYRAMQMWQIVMNSQECKSDETYFKLMYGKNIKRIMLTLEEYCNKLSKRYEDLKAGIPENKENLNEQFTLISSVEIKNGKDKGKIDNRVKDNVLPNDKMILGNHDLIVKPQNSVPKEELEHFEKQIFIKCESLKEKIPFSNILILDIRPRKDFEQSKICNVACVNIPENINLNGLSANKLGEMIATGEEKYYWAHRDQYQQLILMDWHSEEKDVTPASPLVLLRNILLLWDPEVIYQNKPLFLVGGFERWLDMYPTLTTNAKIECPERHTPSTFILLSKHNIEYPINDLDEISSKQEHALIKEVVVPKPISMPSIDRSTKPNTTVGKVNKYGMVYSENNEGDNVRSLLQEEPMEEDKSPAVNDFDHTSPINQPKDKTQDKGPSPSYSYIENKPVRPDTPPRHNRPYSSTPKNILDNGDHDEHVYTETIKSDSLPRSSGLKRSASSPNINKLGDGDLDLTIKNTPKFDRKTKPAPPIYDGYYSPRDTGTDTVYVAYNKEGIGLTGLKNLGNLCYMNSVMQCISNTVELTKELTRFNARESNSRRQIATEVSALLRNLWQGNAKITNCRTLKAKVGSLRHSFSTMEQQDAHEFLTILMDWLHEDLNIPSEIQNSDGAVESTGEKAWGEFKKKQNSLILDLFYGQLKSTVTCKSCGKQSILFEPFSNLSIPLPPQDTPNGQERSCSLEECLKLYLKGETIIGWVCPSCKVPKEAIKKLDITRLPPLLIIHFKRFMNEMVGTGWCRKRMNMVDFPISDFEMKPFIHADSELRHHKYNLYAVSNHYGSLNSGHYTAYCKNHILSKWYKFDDQDVIEMLPNGVKTSAAYILFYESVNLNRSGLKNRIVD